MIEIQSYGAFFDQDPDGFLINPCRRELVPDFLNPLLDKIVERYQSQLGDDLLAVYLRGSAPRGHFVPEISDLDLVGLLRKQDGAHFMRWESPKWAEEETQALAKEFGALARIEMMVAEHDPEIPGQNPRVKMMLKTQALCLWGTDILQEIPGYQVGPALALNCRWVSGMIQQQLENPSYDAEKVRDLMKTILRAGFELVMEREGHFTPDLYLCWQTFARYYPDQNRLMRQVLRIFLNPLSLQGDIAPTLQELGPWLHRKIEEHGPDLL